MKIRLFHRVEHCIQWNKREGYWQRSTYKNIAWFKDQSVVFVIHVVVVASTIKSCWFRRFWQIPETCSSLIMYVCSSTKPGLLTSFSVDPARSWSINSELDREIRRFEAWVPVGNSGFVFQPTPRVYIFLYGPKKKLFNGFLKQPRVDIYLGLVVIA